MPICLPHRWTHPFKPLSINDRRPVEGLTVLSTSQNQWALLHFVFLYQLTIMEEGLDPETSQDEHREKSALLHR